MAHCKSWHAKCQRPVGAAPRKLSFACSESNAPPRLELEWGVVVSAGKRVREIGRHKNRDESTARWDQNTHTDIHQCKHIYTHTHTCRYAQPATSWSLSFFEAFIYVCMYVLLLTVIFHFLFTSDCCFFMCVILSNLFCITFSYYVCMYIVDIYISMNCCIKWKTNAVVIKRKTLHCIIFCVFFIYFTCRKSWAVLGRSLLRHTHTYTHWHIQCVILLKQ